MSELNHEALSRAANEARGLAIDAVHACSSGHLGLPLGAADIGAVLYGQAMAYHPGQPKWLNRDRFILSAGHGSMFLYGWLHMAGYNVPLDEVKNFRQLHSITPGHPEFGETDGVEATTGPLGQGVGNAVGYALSGKMAAAKYNTDEHTIFDQTIFCLAGDGCLQEGVASEAIAFAGHNGLDNLVLIYDSSRRLGPIHPGVLQSAQSYRSRFPHRSTRQRHSRGRLWPRFPRWSQAGPQHGRWETRRTRADGKEKDFQELDSAKSPTDTGIVHLYSRQGYQREEGRAGLESGIHYKSQGGIRHCREILSACPLPSAPLPIWRACLP